MSPLASKESSLVRLITRRELLGFMSTAVAVMIGCRHDRSGALAEKQNTSSAALAAAGPACIARPEQTEGPYFIDEKLNRSDIRSEPSDNSRKLGVPLRVVFQVSRINGGSCKPLNGAIVDVWHCDALGVYSDVRDTGAGFDTRGKKFLRGYQVTNPNGIAEFLTIYPGWYQGRAVHIHFKIRADSSSRQRFEFSSQLYFDESITDEIHKRPPYNGKGYRTTKNEKDFIFRQGGKQLMPTLIKEAEGYTAKFEIGLQLT